MNRHLVRNYQNFRAGIEETVPDTYPEMDRVHIILSTVMEDFVRRLKYEGLKANGSDPAFELEAAMYAYVKRSNPNLMEWFDLLETKGESL